MHFLTTELAPVTREWKPHSLVDFDGAAGNPGTESEKGKLAPYLQLLAGLLESQPRAKIKDFYLLLQERQYLGSYDLVKKKIHSFRKELGRQAAQAFASADLPQAQVEFGKIVFKRGPEEVRAFLFTMMLGHSGRCYAELIETCEMGRFLQAHQNAFESFGGVPKTIFYDPEENPLMRRLVGGNPFHLPVVDCGNHYGYLALPTPAFSPWMEGRLKRPSKILRKLFLPSVHFESFESANASMQDWLARYLRQNSSTDRRDRVQRERLGTLPAVGFNFRGRRQTLRLRA